MDQTAQRDFHHPYQPYEIQVQLMNAIYECIQEEKIGIFESPTGTGKSLSLICSSLTWLRDFQAEQLGKVSDGDGDGEPAWVREQAREQHKQAVIQQKAQVEERLKHIRLSQSKKKQGDHKTESSVKRIKPSESRELNFLGDEAQFQLEEYNSDDVEKGPAKVSAETDQSVSSTNLELMEKLGLVFKAPKEEDHLPEDEIKIYFCSRTHSQLTQFTQELRRASVPPPPWSTGNGQPDQGSDNLMTVKHLPLGSRKNLCINPRVTKLRDATAVNEKCLELQQPGTAEDHKCPFLPTKNNEMLVSDFRDHTLAAIQDIEDLGALGRKVGICPYYASRATIKPSEVVTLPYPLLLQKSAREALDLSLKGHVVIIDEAHNLMDTITSIHSVTITLTQLRGCREALGTYLQKFRNRLKGKNRVYIAQLVRLLDSLSTYLEHKKDLKDHPDGMVGVSELMAGRGVDQVNLYKLMTYLQQSKLARKVEGYIQHEEKQRAQSGGHIIASPQTSPSMPTLTHVQSFLLTLTYPATEGRFFYEKEDEGTVALKYMLLDPAYNFREVVDESRAVILAGGTMSPMEDYSRHLFPHIAPNKVETWSCGHIIPKDNLSVTAIATAADGTNFDFTFKARNSPKVLSALGDSLVELAKCIPDGLVVFFPSYAYLDKVIAHWRSNRTYSSFGRTIWDSLQRCKPIFQEAKSAPVDETLISYSLSISTGKGGLLLSVIGGKLSEGINFSDGLGRGIVVVGLPYPNIQSAQWKAKLDYIEQSTLTRTGSIKEGSEARQDFYENACMRAVNQSIGRAIRHKDDYAAILLFDRRYEGKKIIEKLPGWIRQGMCGGQTEFRSCDEKLKAFFNTKSLS